MPEYASVVLSTLLTEKVSCGHASSSELITLTRSFHSFPLLTNHYLTRDYRAALPILLQDWIAKYHKKAEENGVAVGGISNRELERNRLTILNS
jgi:hypothetical protein